MKVKNNSLSYFTIAKELSTLPSKIVLDGKNLSIADIQGVYSLDTPIQLTTDTFILQKMEKSYNAMMADIKSGIPVYGTNSAFGGQAARILNQGSEEEKINAAREISEALVFLDVTVGPELPDYITRAAMAIRINMLLQGVSGIRISTLESYLALLNNNLIPIVHQYGGIGASGDLAHNQRVVSALRGISGVYLRDKQGVKREAQEALAEAGISSLKLDPKEGLALVNGDNFSTAMAVDVFIRIVKLYLISTVVGAITVEVLRGTNRVFHPLLSQVRMHPGQAEVSSLYRYLLEGSQLAYQELQGPVPREQGMKVQDGYSLRCIPQFEGVMIETFLHAYSTLTINCNSVSDNPVWVPEDDVLPGEKPWQWVSGGNFLAINVAEVMDQLRKVTTQLIKRNDRHLARLIDKYENNGLPANLSDPQSLIHCAFKGVQIQSGMFDVYSMILSQPVTTLFGTHEERNQDITSHALTSGILARSNLEILEYSLAMNCLAIAQAVDLRGGKELLSPKTRPMYEWIRTHAAYAHNERCLAQDIENLRRYIASGDCFSFITNTIYSEYE